MRADIFCRVVDNFGDIGVTWRLARQLHREHGWAVRLWVDQLDSFKRIEPRVTPGVAEQQIADIHIVHWTASGQAYEPRQIVIASFSCDLPPAYVSKMSPQDNLWINLEYLSAEKWVQGCHGLPSLRSDGLSCYFFFPGFATQTGGLLRESTLFEERDAWRANPAEQYRLIKELGVPGQALEAWRSHAPDNPQQGLQTAGHPRAKLISLFCYPDAPIQAFVDILAADKDPWILLIPDGVATHLKAGEQGSLQIVRTPFVSQQEYDWILWTTDLNVVRGEDSFLRALWAGTPFVWHIYPQNEDTHLEKLESWLMLDNLPGPVLTLQRDWNRHVPAEVIRASLKTAFEPTVLQDWRNNAAQFSQKLGLENDLAASLNDFCLQKLGN